MVDEVGEADRADAGEDRAVPRGGRLGCAAVDEGAIVTRWVVALTGRVIRPFTLACALAEVAEPPPDLIDLKNSLSPASPGRLERLFSGTGLPAAPAILRDGMMTVESHGDGRGVEGEATWRVGNIFELDMDESLVRRGDSPTAGVLSIVRSTSSWRFERS